MRKKSRYEYARELIIEAKKGLIAGLPIYGDFDPKTDKRNMLHEGQAEQVDGWNYNQFDEIQFPDRVEFHQKMKSLILATYICLREEEEYRTRIKGGAA